MRGMEGPVMSASRIAARLPARAVALASRPVTRDLPTPPLPLTTPMTLRTSLPALAGASREEGFASEHLLAQLEQS